MTNALASDGPGLLIAAHGEACQGAGNRSVMQLAAALARAGDTREVKVGFFKGEPAIVEALAAFASPTIVVYPLFSSDGYFNRVLLPEALNAGRREKQTIRQLPPLGLEPALADIVGLKAKEAAKSRGFDPAQATLVLLGHGSRQDVAPRSAAEWLAAVVKRQRRFQTVRTAFLEESPALEEAVLGIVGSIIVVGLFSGDGIHGGGDVPRLLATLGRDDTVFAGNIGSYPEIADIIASTLVRWRYRWRDSYACCQIQ